MHKFSLFLALRYLFGIGVLLLSSAYAHATTITSFTANPTTAVPGQVVTFTIRAQTDASVLEGSAILTLSRDGTPVYEYTDSGFLDRQDIGSGMFQDTFALPPQTHSTPGNYTLEIEISGTEDGTTPVSDSATATFVVRQPATAIRVEPSSLSLRGGAGETVSANFTITSGMPPFSLSLATGQISDANPGLNETVTYSVRIPSNATDGQQFSDTIFVTGADGSTATVPVTITATASGGGPSNEEILESMQDIALTGPQYSTATTIGILCPSGKALDRLQQDCNVLVGASFNDKTQATLALGQVTADQASAPVDASQTSVQSQIRNVGTRIAALRGGMTGFSARGLTVNVDGQSLPVGQIAGNLMSGLVGATGGAAGDTALDFGPWGLFINGSYTSGNKDRTENVEGFDYDAASVTLGADYRFSDNLVAGAALGYVKNQTDLDANGGNLDNKGYSLSLYGTYYQDSGLYLDGILTYGWSDYDQQRNILYDIGSVRVNQTAQSDFDGSQWSASIGGGYSFSRGALSFGPTARLEYVETKVDGFQERMSNPNADGGGWATSIDEQDVSSFSSQLGGEVSYAMSTNWGVLLPNAQLEWVHEFEDGAANVVGHFVQDTSRTPFSLPTDNLDQDYFNLRLGVTAQFANGRSGYIYYRKLFDYSDLDAYTIGGGLRLEF